MAHLSEDPNMTEAFREGNDIHAATAAKIWHEDISQVTDAQRKKAKTANFGIIYGITTFGLPNKSSRTISTPSLVSRNTWKNPKK